MPETVCIAGPMTGRPDNNHEAFNMAAADLRAAGFHVINPAEINLRGVPATWENYMRRCIERIIHDADVVALLPGWEKSVGAQLEVQIARAFSLEVAPVECLLNPRRCSLGARLPYDGED